LPYLEARLAAERIAPPNRLPRVTEPSIWRDVRLASRLTERILDRVPADERAATGVVLLGPGIPSAWHSQSRSWLEDETYFLTRVTVLLEDAGVPSHAIRSAWVDWQSPNLAEALRHLAAIGSTRIVVCPATILYPDLVTLLDTGRYVRDARLPEHVQVTVLPPWGDDEVLIDVVASRIAQALGLEPDAR
jgi:protoheme ferro-lyase